MNSTSIIFVAAFASLLAVLLVLRTLPYGELHISELPILLLALLAGDAERKRLRLLLTHRGQQEQADDSPPETRAQKAANSIPGTTPRSPATRCACDAGRCLECSGNAHSGLLAERNRFARRLAEGGPFDGWTHSGLYFMDGYRARQPGFVATRSTRVCPECSGNAQTDLHRKRDRFQRRLSEGPRQPDTTVPATASQYAAWLRGYTGRGGKPTHFCDFPFSRAGFRYAASSPLIVESDYEYGTNSRKIVIAEGVKAQGTHPDGPFNGWAHSILYFMDGYRARAPEFVPVYSDPEFDFTRSGQSGQEK
jgi:hypothetical protein